MVSGGGDGRKGNKGSMGRVKGEYKYLKNYTGRNTGLENNVYFTRGWKSWENWGNKMENREFGKVQEEEKCTNRYLMVIIHV